MGEWIPNPEASLPTGLVGPGIFVNQPGSPAAGREILRMMSNATDSIDIISFAITDQNVLNSLLVAKGKRVRVRVITELRENRGRGISYPTQGFDVDLSKIERNTHNDTVRELVRHRIPCRSLAHYTHVKYVMIDSREMMLSSVNLMPNSLGWGKQPAWEAGIQITDTRDIILWKTAFNELWDCCPFRMHLLEKDVSLQEQATRPLDIREFTCELPSGGIMAWTFPALHHGLQEKLAYLCSSAEQRIVFCAMSFYELDQVPQLRSAIVEALKRGVEIIVVIRPEDDKGCQYKEIDTDTLDLISQGLKVVGRSRLHAKGVSIDGSRAAILTGNFNPYSLAGQVVSDHVECGMIQHTANNTALEAYARVLEWLAAHPTHRYEL